jgi:hypothetical protein
MLYLTNHEVLRRKVLEIKLLFQKDLIHIDAFGFRVLQKFNQTLLELYQFEQQRNLSYFQFPSCVSYQIQSNHKQELLHYNH